MHTGNIKLGSFNFLQIAAQYPRVDLSCVGFFCSVYFLPLNPKAVLVLFGVRFIYKCELQGQDHPLKTKKLPTDCHILLPFWAMLDYRC